MGWLLFFFLQGHLYCLFNSILQASSTCFFFHVYEIMPILLVYTMSLLLHMQAECVDEHFFLS